jgi:hypothetical protein
MRRTTKSDVEITMQSNKLRMAIRSTAAVAILGVAGQASAIDLATGDYSASLYGFVRAVASYDMDQDIATGGQAASYSAITGGANSVDGHYGMDAFTSRLGVSVMTPEGVKAVVEMDFDNDDTQEPRIRHAYGEYKGVMIGRYWSNYNSWVGNTSQLDFDGVPGSAGFQNRTSQFRYTSGPLSVSLEQPNGSVFNGNSRNGLPAATVRFENSMDALTYSAAALVKQVTFDDGTQDDSVFGYAAFLAAKLALSDTFSVQGAVNVGDGANSYVYRSGDNFAAPDAFVNNNELETVETFSATLGVSMKTGSGSSVNVLYGFADTDLDDSVAAGTPVGTHETNSMASINYQWTPVKNVKMGAQYAYHEVEFLGGNKEQANRVMFLAQYSF